MKHLDLLPQEFQHQFQALLGIKLVEYLNLIFIVKAGILRDGISNKAATVGGHNTKLDALGGAFYQIRIASVHSGGFPAHSAAAQAVGLIIGFHHSHVRR